MVREEVVEAGGCGDLQSRKLQAASFHLEARMMGGLQALDAHVR